MKYHKIYDTTSSLILGIFLAVFGILILIFKDGLYIKTVNIIVSCVLVGGIVQFVHYFFRKEKSTDAFIKSLVSLLFALIMSLVPSIPLAMVPLAFALYMLTYAGIRFACFIVFKNNDSGESIKALLTGILYLVIAVPLLFAPIKNMTISLMIIGGYFVLLGIYTILEQLMTLIPKDKKKKLKRRIRVTIPVLLESIIPYTLLREINNMLNEEDKKQILTPVNKEGITPDMEVFVHVSNRGFNRFGHVDIYYNGKIIAYGNYDDASYRMFSMIGDGVIFETPHKNKYIDFCIDHSKKTLFGFGLKLTDNQKKNIEKYIDKLYSNLVPWNPPYKEDYLENSDINKDDYGDYASCLYKKTKADFYKFKSGKYKTFFVLGTNCCFLADSIIGKSGIDLLKMNGLITPGTYYEFLNREFNKKNSIVISKTVYNEETRDKKKFKSKKSRD